VGAALSLLVKVFQAPLAHQMLPEIILHVLTRIGAVAAGFFTLGALMGLPNMLLTGKYRDLDAEQLKSQCPSQAWVAAASEWGGCLTLFLGFPVLIWFFRILFSLPSDSILFFFSFPVVPGSLFVVMPAAFVEIVGQVSPQMGGNKNQNNEKYMFRVGPNIRHCGLARLVMTMLVGVAILFFTIVSRATH